MVLKATTLGKQQIAQLAVSVISIFSMYEVMLEAATRTFAALLPFRRKLKNFKEYKLVRCFKLYHLLP